MKTAILSIVLLLACFADATFAAPPAMKSTPWGITAPTWTEANISQRSSVPIPAQTAQVFLRQWCFHNEQGDLSACIDDPCYVDDCNERWPRAVVFFTGPYQTIRPAPGLALDFAAILPDYSQVSGSWFGPADVNMDGTIDSGDFFAFTVDFFAGDEDFNLDGSTNTQDFFDFVSWFNCCK